jgi:hypothetical protein
MVSHRESERVRPTTRPRRLSLRGCTQLMQSSRLVPSIRTHADRQTPSHRRAPGGRLADRSNKKPRASCEYIRDASVCRPAVACFEKTRWYDRIRCDAIRPTSKACAPCPSALAVGNMYIHTLPCPLWSRVHVASHMRRGRGAVTSPRPLRLASLRAVAAAAAWVGRDGPARLAPGLLAAGGGTGLVGSARLWARSTVGLCSREVSVW